MRALATIVFKLRKRLISALAVRPDFAREFVETLFASNQPESFELFMSCMRRSGLQAVQREHLLKFGYEGFNATNIPNSVLDVFEAASDARIHYSQEGEDLVLARFLSRDKGFFIDIGAHHATRFSNTFALYRRGWRGINVDATPGSMDSFRRLRPEDINVECAISDSAEPMKLRVFQDGALNTSRTALAEAYVRGGWELKETLELIPRRLSAVLDEFLPEGQHIDLLNIDVEGGEMAVLQSNDWSRHSPDVIVIEVLDTPMLRLKEHPAIRYLSERGFVPVSRLTNSVVLRRE